MLLSGSVLMFPITWLRDIMTFFRFLHPQKSTPLSNGQWDMSRMVQPPVIQRSTYCPDMWDAQTIGPFALNCSRHHHFLMPTESYHPILKKARSLNWAGCRTVQYDWNTAVKTSILSRSPLIQNSRKGILLRLPNS